MPRIENPLFLSIYSQMVDSILTETSNIEEANERLRSLGKQMAQQIYLTTELVDKTKETVNTREDVSKLVEAIFKVLFDKKPSEIDMETARGSIRVSDDECIWCQEVNLDGMIGFGYCEAFSGILQSILEFKNVEAKVFEESCKATGSEYCTWNIRLM